MCFHVEKFKKVIRRYGLSLCMCLFCAMFCSMTVETRTVFASEVLNGEEQAAEGDISETGANEVLSGNEKVTSEKAEEEEPPFTAKENFVIFVCCLFSVALCVVIGLYGNPNDRLKDKYKRARKQQLLQEKKKKESEERAAKRAAEEAKYAEELALYEADVKAYEEAKAAKAAAKAAKKAAKKK